MGGVAAAFVGVAALATAMYAFLSLFVPVHDTLIYELAGQRVNTGGQVYDLRPGDPLTSIDDRSLPPLFSPPVVVLPFRLLALFGGWGLLAWIAVSMFAALASMAYVLLVTRGWAGVLLVPLSIGIASSLTNGNVDNLLLGGMLLAWHFRDNPKVGILVGVMALVKLTPAVLLVWLVATGRWRAVLWALVSMAGLAILTALFTEPGIWFRYLSVMTAATGAGRVEAMLAVVAGLALILVLGRRYPAAAFVTAIAVIPFGSPQAGPHTGILLVGCLAPLMDRWPASEH